MRTAHRCITKTAAPTIRRCVRRLSHRCTWGRRAKQTNHFPALVTALRRAIRIRRRLMKLFPEFYDNGFYIAAQKRWEEDEQRRRIVEPILRRVYGEPEPDPAVHPPAFRFSHPPMTKAKRRKIEILEAEYELWMTIATATQEQADKQLQGHRPLFPSLGTLASLLELGSTFGRIATGMETNFKADPAASLYARDVNADLERIYGDHCAIGQPDPIHAAPKKLGDTEDPTTLHPHQLQSKLAQSDVSFPMVA